MLLAVLQAEAAVLEPEENLRRIAASAAAAAEAGAELLLTPELFPVGYAPARVRAELDPQRLPELAARLAGIARDHRIALVYSLPSVGPDGRWRITATLVDSGGRRVLEYAKVHLFGSEERAAFVPAEEPPAVAEWNGVRTALLVCYDVEFPEAVRAAADRGAELLLVPTALADGFESVPQVLVRARALESQLVIGYANHSGTEQGEHFLGGSVVVGPEGELLAQAGPAGELLFATVDPHAAAAARRRVPYLTERRPELYRRWEQQPRG